MRVEGNLRFRGTSSSPDVALEVHGQGNIRAENHGIAVFAIKLDQRVLAGYGIL